MGDIELNNLDHKPEEEPEEQQEQETNIDDWRDQSIVIIDTSNPDAEIPNPRKDVGVIRTAYTEDKNFDGDRKGNYDNGSVLPRLRDCRWNN